ncbi:metallophosphoesterase [Pseudomonas syringae]|uniref:metallophosphoesterase n=1 Tax=Pseudomonas syringae TaxID=317 RepID=UPI0006E6AD4E|nr:metallophosphoesterase [Pseudomonas syringae]KPY53644.1 Uncharacterized protein ALO46_02938 [Pseudomonas syringae pv. solidagae]RMT29076.1 hypothetical protein ALP49_03418 [Pseudomonas syringae pv. solidagae]
MKKILQISDIHASIIPAKGQQRHDLAQLRESFFRDGEVLTGVDSIIVSGDLTYSGQEEEFQLFNSEILSPLKDLLKLENDSVFFSPGNHDANWKNFTFSQKKAIKSIRQQYDSLEIQLLQEEMFAGDLHPCSGWLSHVNNFYKDSGAVLKLEKLYQTYSHGKVGIASLNSGWSSIGEGDREFLFIGEKQVDLALKSIRNFNEKIILLHHPLEWLHPEERRMLASYITKGKISAIFYGHMHEFNMLRESAFSEDFVMKLQAGRFDLSGKEKSGYSIITLNHSNNLRSGRIEFRRFDDEDKLFAPWLDRCPNGYIDYESIPTIGFNREAFAEDCTKASEKFEYDLMCNTGVVDNERKRLTDIFICPSIKVVSHDIDKEGGERYIDFEQLSSSASNFVMVGGENSGKSTILKSLVLSRLKSQSRLQLDEIVFYFDCKGKKIPSKHRLKSDLIEIYEPCQNSDLYVEVLKNKITTENALLIFDGFDDLSAHCQSEVFSFLNDFKEPRFIISCKHASSQELTTSLKTKLSIDFVELNIGGMKRSHLKGLVGKWLPDPTARSSVAREILKAVENAGMPNNLFVYSMLLSIYERKQGNFSTYLHEADLVENFIEVIMHKHCITRKRAPQYKDLLRLLGSVAEQMIIADRYALKFSEVDALIVKFNKDIAQDFPVNDYLNPILASGVLEATESEYRFSQACFFDYSYARYLSSRNINYSDLHNTLDFLRFDKVVEYISAILKNDTALLDFCKTLTEDAWSICNSSENLIDLKSATDELESAAKSDILDSLKDELIDSSFQSEPPKEQEIYDKLDSSRPLRTNAQNGESRAFRSDLQGATLFQSSLSLYARVFRAAEHITDREQADAHFDAALNFYERTIALNTRKFHEQLRPIVIEKLIEHSKFQELNPEQKIKTRENINAFLNFVVASFPNFTVSMMASDLVNARQINRLKKKRDESDNNLQKIIITYSLCELDEIDTLSEVKSIKPQRSFEYSSVIMKIIELSHMDFTLSEDVRKDLIKHAHTLLKNKKARKLVNDMSEISVKITGELLESKLKVESL